MVQGSGKAAFAFIRADEAVEARPFQDLPVSERPHARRNYWKARWGEAEADCAWPSLGVLQDLAAKQAGDLKPISTAQIVETLKYTPNKKGGPDGCTFRMLKMLPTEALSGLVYIFTKPRRVFVGRSSSCLCMLLVCPKTWIVSDRLV